jgi:hypothetical protein
MEGMNQTWVQYMYMRKCHDEPPCIKSYAIKTLKKESPQNNFHGKLKKININVHGLEDSIFLKCQLFFNLLKIQCNLNQNSNRFFKFNIFIIVLLFLFCLGFW